MDDKRIRSITRPSPKLLTQFAISAIPSLLFWPIAMVPLYFKYHTLRYQFDEEGVHASWGILFNRQIQLTYRRIQDIHVHRNLVERWLGIGRIEVQTASGSSSAELTIWGVEEFEEIRDFLYSRMRGHATTPAAGPSVGEQDASDDDVVPILREIREELAGARRAAEELRA